MGYDGLQSIPLSEVGILGRGHGGRLQAVPPRWDSCVHLNQVSTRSYVRRVGTDMLCPVHVGVEYRITRLADIQPAPDTLAIVFLPADATDLACIVFGQF